MAGSPGRQRSQPLRQPTWLIALGAGLGVLAICAGFIAAMFNKEMDDFARAITWLLAAFGVAAASHVFSGEVTIEVDANKISIPQKIRAGGSFALFIFIMSVSPGAQSITQAVWPENPKSTSDTYVAAMDNNNLNQAWNVFSDWGKNTLSFSDFTNMYNNVRQPFGTAESRILKMQNQRENPEGLPRGAYVAFTYETSFRGAQAQRAVEQVIVGTESGKPRVFGYFINIVP